MKKLLSSLVMAATVAMISSAAFAQAAPTLKICTGGKDGKYFEVGTQLHGSLKGKIDVQVFDSVGSDSNLRRMENAAAPDGCDAALVQSDAMVWYNQTYKGNALKIERTQAMYPEYVHLICGKDSGIDKVKDFYGTKDKKVAIGKPGSGTQITWSNFTKVEKRYEPIPTADLSGTIAVNRTKSGENACFMFTAGLRTGAINRVNAETVNSELRLVPLNDGDLTNAKDEKGKSIYRWTKIPSGTYPNLQTGVFSNSVDTIAQDAWLVVNSDWVEKNDRGYTDLSTAAAKLAKQLNAQ